MVSTYSPQAAVSLNAPAHSSTLPRLLYLADVPVEASYHGSALIFRLLQKYPSERLRIVEGGLSESKPERRLPEVQYQRLPLLGSRGLTTRFHKWVSSAYSLRATFDVQRLSNLIVNFKCDAVLTVAHGYSWLTAAAYARQQNIPLHLIVHDDWPRVLADVSPVRQWVDRQFGRCYREAVSRLCVSPFMVEDYERRYAATGTVLYPSRAAEAVSYTEPPDRLCDSSRPLTCIFAGTVNSPGYLQALRSLSDALVEVGGRLLIYGPFTQQQAAEAGLSKPNVEVRGLLPSNELIGRLREEADVLFVPMSFRSEDSNNMKISFPSKLTDYTALGLPLLIYGPPYCSAIRWAMENPDTAEVVDVEGRGELVAAVHHLANDSEYRLKLAGRAIEVGNRYFSHTKAVDVINSSLGSC